MSTVPKLCAINPKEPMLTKPWLSRPFEELATDFCYHVGQCYLIIVDCYTDWPTIAPMMKNVNAAALITVLRELRMYFAEQLYLICFGPMEDRSSFLRSFKVLQHSEVLNTKHHHHPTTRKVMGRQK